MERIISTFEKALAVKESKGEIIYLSRSVSVKIDKCISNTLNNKTNPKKKDKR